jgi:3-methyladenine DNA glycosylase AlkD
VAATWRLVVDPGGVKDDTAHGVDGVVSRLDAGLRAAAVPGRAESEKRYLKSELVHYGTPMPAIRALAREVAKGAGAGVGPDGPGRDELVEVVLRLWFALDEPVHERRMAGAVLLEARAESLTADDVPVLERLLRASRTWALVDLLAGGVAGPLLDSGPRAPGAAMSITEATAVLDRWAGDGDVWVRRSALLAHERALRSCGGDFTRFARYADAMLEEREFFIRKAIGWVLRSASGAQPEVVVAWSLPRAGRMSGVTFRELVRHLPAVDVAALQAVRAR